MMKKTPFGTYEVETAIQKTPSEETMTQETKTDKCPRCKSTNIDHHIQGGFFG